MSDAEPKFIPLANYREYPPDEMLSRARQFRKDLQRRRSVRHFSDRPVDQTVIEECIKAAVTAPSGANKQPWHFVAVHDQTVKHKIRVAAEKEEHEFYKRRATDEWLEALEPLDTGPEKPFLDIAPWLIAIFSESYGMNDGGEKKRNYYVRESLGIATGMLITACHRAGLATLTHTPSPMGFLNRILDRPENEKPFLLLVVGYPADEAKVPNITKKSFSEITTFI